MFRFYNEGDVTFCSVTTRNAFVIQVTV